MKRRRKGFGEAPASLTRPACRKAWDAAERLKKRCSGGATHGGWAWVAGPCISLARLAQKAAEGGRCDAALTLTEKAGRAAAALAKRGGTAGVARVKGLFRRKG